MPLGCSSLWEGAENRAPSSDASAVVDSLGHRTSGIPSTRNSDKKRRGEKAQVLVGAEYLILSLEVPAGLSTGSQSCLHQGDTGA